MSIKFRLTAMQFLQFFVWGAWLISLGGYMGGTLHFEGGQIGAIFATMGIASIIMPGLTGIIADKWVNAERLYGILHQLTQPADHPVNIYHPEGEYLKGLVLYVE